MGVTVAIVGRPNVGKSRLFNALLKRRVAIVHDQPGVTRDLNSAELAPGLTLVDTGGWGLGKIKNAKAENAEILARLEEQLSLAIEAADKILFVVDGRAGSTALDTQIASHLRPHKEKVLLVLNKVDSEEVAVDIGEFLRLGFAQWQYVSAEHGRGIEGVRNALLKLAPRDEPSQPQKPTLAIMGRPNVGKSSLTNALLGEKRVIVSGESGTTRDPVAVDLTFVGKKGRKYEYRLVDTAGLRHRTKVASPVEVFSQIKTREALQGADIVVLLIDALDGVTSQDKLLAGEIQKAGKPLVIAINKWDLAKAGFTEGKRIEGYETLQEFEAACRENVEDALFFTAQTPILFLSAKEELNFEILLQIVQTTAARQDKTFPTPEVNRLLEQLLRKSIPRNTSGKIFKVYYATQTGKRPYRFKLFCNQVEGVNDSFKRYLAKGFVDYFEIAGCPIFFDFVSKPPRVQEKGKKPHNGKKSARSSKRRTFHRPR